MPSLAENLATMAQRTARLESELDALAGTNTFPEWWYQGGVSFSELKSQLSNPEADPQAISQYFQLYDRQQQLRTSITGHEPYANSLTSLCSDLGTEVVGRGLAAEPLEGPMHTAMLERLVGGEEHEYGVLLDALSQVYGVDNRTALLGIKGEYGDMLKPLLRTEKSIKTQSRISPKQ